MPVCIVVCMRVVGGERERELISGNIDSSKPEGRTVIPGAGTHAVL